MKRPTVGELRARLAKLMGKESPPQSEDAAAISEMFAECQRESVEMGWQDEAEPRHVLRDDGLDEPLPAAKERGKKYCQRCGMYKRLESFDDGAVHCRSHGSDPPKRARAA